VRGGGRWRGKLTEGEGAVAKAELRSGVGRRRMWHTGIDIEMVDVASVLRLVEAKPLRVSPGR